MFGTLDCSHNLQTLICVIIIKAIQFQPLVDGHILFKVSFWAIPFIVDNLNIFSFLSVVDINYVS